MKLVTLFYWLEKKTGLGVLELLKIARSSLSNFHSSVPATTKLFIHKNLFVALLITYLVYITATLARKSLSENRVSEA